MFYFELCACPQCGQLGSFLPDFDATIKDYLQGYDSGTLLILDEESPPHIPEYMVFTCIKEDCGFVRKFTDTEAVQFAREALAKVVWKEWQSRVRQSSNFEQYFTRYLFDKGIMKFITEHDEISNPWLKDYIKAVVRKNETKHSKISKD